MLVALSLQRWQATQESSTLAAVACVMALVGFAAALGFAADQDRPRGRGAGEWALLRPGAVWGLRYVVVLLALPAALSIAIALRAGGEDAAAIAAAPSYVLIYISAALLICRGLGGNRLAAPDVVRGVAILLVLFCGVLPAALATMANASNSVWAALPSPFMGTVNLAGSLTPERTRAAGVLLVTALILTAAADRTLVKRARRAIGYGK